MVQDLSKKISLSITPESIDNLKAARKEIQALEQMMQNISKLKINVPGMGTPGGGPGSGGKPPASGDAAALKAAREEMALARSEALLYGRERDNLRAKLEKENVDTKTLNAELLKHSQTSLAARGATEALANAKKILTSVEDVNIKSSATYKKALSDVASQELLLRNRMMDATPMRRMSAGFGQISSVMTGLSPQFSMIMMQFEGVKRILSAGLGLGPEGFIKGNLAKASSGFDDIKKARQELATAMTQGTAGADGMSAAFLRLGGAGGQVAAAFAGIAGMIGAMVTAGGVLLGVFGGLAVGLKAIGKGAEMESTEEQMAALIGSTTKFQDKATKAFVSPVKQLEASLAHAKTLISMFAEDLPKLKEVTMKDLTDVSTASLARLGSIGIVDPRVQADLIEKLAVALKVVNKSSTDTAEDLGKQARGIMEGQFRVGNKLAVAMMAKYGVGKEGKKVFQEMVAEAQKTGKFAEFLTKELEPFNQMAAFTQGSLTNLESIFGKFMGGMTRKLSESGLMDAAKNFVKDFLSPFVEMNDPAKFGTMSEGAKGFAKDFGADLAKLFDAFRPLASVASQALIGIALALKSAVEWVTPAIALFDGLVKGIADFISWLVKLVSGGKGAEQMANALALAFSLLALTFNPIIGVIGLIVTALRVLEDVFPGITSALLGMAQDWDKTWDFMLKKVQQAVIDILVELGKMSESFDKAAKKAPGKAGFGFQFLTGMLGAASASSEEDLSKQWAGFKTKGGETLKKTGGLGGLLGLGQGSPGAVTKETAEKQAQKQRKIEDEAEALQQAKLEKKYQDELYAISLRQAKLDKERLQTQEKLTAAQLKQKTELEKITGKEGELDLDNQRLDLLEKQKKISEATKIALQNQNAEKKITLEREKDLADLAEKQAQLNAKAEENATNVKNRGMEEEKLQAALTKANDDLNAKKAQQETLRKKGLLDAENQSKIEKEINGLIAKQTEAQRNLTAAKGKSVMATQSEEDALKAQQVEFNLAKQTADRENRQKISEQKIKYQEQVADLNQKIKDAAEGVGKSVLDAGMAISDQIARALEDGSISIADAFAIFDTAINKLTDIFSKISSLSQLAGGAMGGGGGAAGAGGGFLSFFSSLFGGGQKTGGGSGAVTGWSDTLGKMRTLTGPNALENAQKLGLKNITQSGGAAGGALGGIGSASGMLSAAGPWGMAASAAIQVGTMVFGFLQSMQQNKIKKQIERFQEVMKQEEKKVEKADNELYESGLVKLNDQIKARQAAVKAITDAYARLGKKAKSKVGEDFQNSIDKLNLQIEQMQIEMGKSFLDFQTKLTGSRIKDKDLKQIATSLQSIFTEGFQLVAGGFDPKQVQEYVNNELGSVRDDFFKNLDDQIAQNLQSRNDLLQQSLDQTKQDLQTLADNLRGALETGGFMAAKTTDAQIRDAIKTYKDTAAKAKADQLKQMTDLTTQEKTLADQRAAGEALYSSEVAKNLSMLSQYAAVGSIEKYQQQLGASLSNIQVSPETTKYFVTAITGAMNQSLQNIADALPRA